MTDEMTIVPVGIITQSILLIRGQKVILDSDLARLYGVTTNRFNEQIKRNLKRFPDDFMFQLEPEETRVLRSQFATSKRGSGGRRYSPYAFTEHGAIMAASVLNSPQAVKVSVYVVRAFVKLREMLANSRLLANRLTLLESKLHKHDGQIVSLIEAIQQLMEPSPERKRKRIGFASEMEKNG
jgi:hypothetical protein